MMEEFEEWFSDKFGWPKHDIMTARATDDFGVDCYIFRDENREASIVLSTAWIAWQASRASLVIELPRTIGGGYYESSMAAACRRAIEAAGVKVKP